MGFVNSEWAIKGALKPNNNSKIFVDGQTFDKKLYTFKETDYKQAFMYLNIFVKKRADALFDNMSQEEEILSDSSIAVSNYGPSSRRIEMNMSKNSKINAKQQPAKRGSSDSLDMQLMDGKLKVVKKDKSKSKDSENLEYSYSIFRDAVPISQQMKDRKKLIVSENKLKQS